MVAGVFLVPPSALLCSCAHAAMVSRHLTCLSKICVHHDAGVHLVLMTIEGVQAFCAAYIPQLHQPICSTGQQLHITQRFYNMQQCNKGMRLGTTFSYTEYSNLPTCKLCSIVCICHSWQDHFMCAFKAREVLSVVLEQPIRGVSNKQRSNNGSNTYAGD